MFPVETSSTARPWAGDPFYWVGVAQFHYADGRVVEEVLLEKGSLNLPQLFTSAEAASQAAQSHAQTFRLSDQTERLTGNYGGDS